MLVGLLVCWLVGFNIAQANTVSHHFRPHYVVKTNHVVTAICKRLGKCSFLDPRRKTKQFNKVMAFLSAGHHSGHHKLLCFPSHIIHLIHLLSMRELRHIQSQHPAQSPGCLRGAGLSMKSSFRSGLLWPEISYLPSLFPDFQCTEVYPDRRPA